MDISQELTRLNSMLVDRTAFELLGAQHLRLPVRLRRLDLVQLHRRWFLPGEAWRSLPPEARHLAQILAAHRSAIRPPLFSHYSAAALHGLPLFPYSSGPVHTITSTGGAGRASSSVRRHRLELDDADTTSVAGIRCTSPDRTLFDLARVADPALALSCADAWLRRTVRDGRDIDQSAWHDWRCSMLERVTRLGHARGTRRARDVLIAADPRSDSPLESVSRLHLTHLGFDLELQVPVPSPTGHQYSVDFEFIGLGIFGECDGKLKYFSEEVRGGRRAEEIIYAEKKREDWIRGTTGKRLIRWGADDVRSRSSLAKRLAAFGVPVPLEHFEPSTMRPLRRA